MSAVTVFVDDAVTGRFPEVCAKTGRPSDGWMRLEAGLQKRRSTGQRWVVGLVFLAAMPVAGIVVLPLLATALLVAWAVTAAMGEEALAVQLPWSEDTYQRSVAALGQQRQASAVAIVGLLGALLSAFVYGRFYAAVALVTVGVVATVVLAVYGDQLNRQQVVAELDASRRWVTLSRVHPDFAAAVLAHSPSARTHDS